MTLDDIRALIKTQEAALNNLWGDANDPDLDELSEFVSSAVKVRDEDDWELHIAVLMKAAVIMLKIQLSKLEA